MTLSLTELSLLFLALNQTEDGKPRKFQFTELGMIAELSKKLSDLAEDGKLTKSEYTVEFTTDEKVKIKGFIEEHKWQTGDAANVLSLVEKLK